MNDIWKLIERICIVAMNAEWILIRVYVVPPALQIMVDGMWFPVVLEVSAFI